MVIAIILFYIFVLGAIAEFERALIQERTRAGLSEARRRGRMGGRPKLMSSKDVSAARALLKLEDVTAAEVAKRFGASRATLYRHLEATGEGAS